jgi:hypothetical protein
MITQSSELVGHTQDWLAAAGNVEIGGLMINGGLDKLFDCFFLGHG